ncbi:uncharacterized protein N7477_005274, partial [Penicillium maclennaniae]|uniref:uncharacterized protein n=1 Tax=Penicillium maclennaniae TaxID=1343394 RepID=UPI002540BBE5
CIPSVTSTPLPISCTNKTTYARILREEEEIDIIFNIAISAANWALLTGYLVAPGIFTSLQSSDEVERALQANKAGRTVLHIIQNPLLLSVAYYLFLGGIAAFVWLLHFPKLRGNYIWLVNKLFASVVKRCCWDINHNNQRLCISRRRLVRNGYCNNSCYWDDSPCLRGSAVRLQVLLVEEG